MTRHFPKIKESLLFSKLSKTVSPYNHLIWYMNPVSEVIIFPLFVN